MRVNARRLPRIRVVLPAHSESRLLEKAVVSIQEQTFEEWAMSLVLDAPSRSTVEVALSVSRSDPRITVRKVGYQNLGQVLQDATQAVDEEYIARMDADDIAMRDRFAKQVGYLDIHKNVVAVGSDVVFIDSRGRPFARSRNATDHKGIYQQLRRGRGGAIFHPTVMLRTDALRASGGYSGRYVRGQDLDVYLKLSEMGELANINDVLLKFRKHDASSTAGEDPTEAKNRRLETIAAHLQRVGAVEHAGEVLEIRNIPAYEQMVIRLRSALRFRYYGTALAYAVKVGLNPRAMWFLFRGVRRKIISRITRSNGFP